MHTGRVTQDCCYRVGRWQQTDLVHEHATWNNAGRCSACLSQGCPLAGATSMRGERGPCYALLTRGRLAETAQGLVHRAMVGAVTMIFSQQHASRVRAANPLLHSTAGTHSEPCTMRAYTTPTNRHYLQIQTPPRPQVVVSSKRIDGSSVIRASTRIPHSPHTPHFLGTRHAMQTNILIPDASWRLPAAAAEPATTGTLLPAVALVVAGVTNRVLCTLLCSSCTVW